MSTAGDTTTDIRTFRIDIADEQIDDLRKRIAATRWPSKELVDDRSQGVQLATMQALVRYWTTEYDFGRLEARLNALPQFMTEIDGVDIHFIHVRSPHEDALPLIMTHGWPGSVIELLETVGPLTDPTAHGGVPRGRIPPGAAVLARLRLLGRADRARLGVRPHRPRVGRADGTPRLLALRRPRRRRRRRRDGGDGPPGTRRAARHPREPARRGARSQGPAAGRVRAGTRGARGAQHVHDGRLRLLLEQSTRPQTIGYSVPDSPVGWRPGCSTTTPTATSRSPACSSTASPRATSPETTSSTTSRCTG